MGDLVLKTRVAVTRSNLSRIEQLRHTLEQRDARVEEFLNLPSDLDQLIVAAIGEISELRNPARFDLPAEADVKLGELDARLREARATVQQKTAAAAQLRAEFEALTGDRQDVKNFLVGEAGEVGRRLSEANYWDQRPVCESLFSEYVDLVRGVAIRSTGMQDETGRLSDLFALADHLPALWASVGRWSWQSLAVPSDAESNASTQARVLRIGFPEWTVWALPLLQHEFGHVVITEYKSEIGFEPDTPTRETMLADALALLVTGPAYALAALLLRLDPAGVRSAPPPADPLTAGQVLPVTEAAVRSASVLHALARAADVTADPTLQTLATRLHDEWRDAVASAGGEPQALDDALGLEDVAQAVDAAAKFLGAWDPAPDKRPDWMTNWATITAWAGLLRDGKAAAIDVAQSNADDGERPVALTLLLNAAWFARVGTDPDHDAEADDIVQIGAAAMERMREVVRGRTRGQSGRVNRPGGR